MKSIFLFTLAIFLASCASLPSSAKQGQALSDRGKHKEADLSFERTMSENLAEDEFELVAELRCEARKKFVKQQLATLTNGTPETYFSLMKYISRCEDFAESHALLYDELLKSSESKIKNLRSEIAKGNLKTSLAPAISLLRFLPPGHPFEKDVASLREKVRAEYQQDAVGQAPNVARLFEELGFGTKGTDKKIALSDVEKLSASLGEHHLAAVQFAMDPSCQSQLNQPQLPTTASPGSGMKAIIEFSKCSIQVQVLNETESYEVFEKVVKSYTVKEYKQTPVVSYKSGYNCSSQQSCVRTTQRVEEMKTTTSNRTYTKVVEEKVTKYRPVRRVAAVWQTSVRIKIQDEFSNIVFAETISTTRKNDRVFQDNESVQSTVNAMTTKENARPFFSAISKKLTDEINAKMKRVKAHTLVQRGTPDALLAAWFLSPEELKPGAQVMLKKVLGVDVIDLPKNPFFEPERLKTEFAYSPFPYFPKEDLFSFGYPELALGIGLLYGQTPTDLVGQPDRSYFGVRITTNFRKSFMTGANAKGIGFMLGADGTFGIASRYGDDYKRTRAPNPIYFENEEEEVGIVPLYEGQVFGALGFRLRQFALFGGAAPRFDGGVIGFYRTHGAAIPYFGRLELRFVERFPIVIEGRYGNLLDSTNNSQGGTIEIPISEGFWIQGGFFQTTLPAQFFGLDQRDKVRIDAATLSTGHLGMWYGF